MKEVYINVLLDFGTLTLRLGQVNVKASEKGGGRPSLTSPHTPLPEIQRIKQTLCVIALRLHWEQGHNHLKAISVEKVF